MPQQLLLGGMKGVQGIRIWICRQFFLERFDLFPRILQNNKKRGPVNNGLDRFRAIFY